MNTWVLYLDLDIGSSEMILNASANNE